MWERTSSGEVMITTSRAFRAALMADMKTEQRLSTVEAESRGHYKSCDERGARIERSLTAMASAQDDRHSENQKAISGLYSRMWAVAGAVIVGMAGMIGYLLIHGAPWFGPGMVQR